MKIFEPESALCHNAHQFNVAQILKTLKVIVKVPQQNIIYCNKNGNCLNMQLTVTNQDISILIPVKTMDLDAQEFIQLTTRYPMTNLPNEQINRRTTQLIKKAITPYPFMDYFPSFKKAEKWPLNTVYYVKEDVFRKKFDLLIEKCFKILQSKTCLNFLPYTAQEQNVEPLRIYSTKEYRCIVTVGYNRSGLNRMILNDRFCKDEISILHLLIHVLGFDHEHTRKDRDFFIIPKLVPDQFIANELDIKLHHNTYNYMPYNWQSIMHIIPTYPIIAHKHIPSRLQSHAEPTNPYLIHEHGPSFKDWFSNTLHQFDINNINRHYQCGEYSSLCRDYFGRENCTKFGLGASTFDDGHIVNIAAQARCMDRNFAERRCPKTCGACVRFYKHDVQLRQLAKQAAAAEG
uniref:Metalloendopeptidase n=1 Tax=Romanomermis culicivorax TaxID=13658 RepID=A0A915L3K0_ROMCU